MRKLLLITGIFSLTVLAAQAMTWDHFRRSSNVEDRSKPIPFLPPDGFLPTTFGPQPQFVWSVREAKRPSE